MPRNCVIMGVTLPFTILDGGDCVMNCPPPSGSCSLPDRDCPAGAAIGADVWQRHSITNQHNRLWKGDPKYRFSAMVNDSSVFETLSYTSIVPTGPQSAVITYNKFDYEQIGRGNVSWPGPSANFAISVTVESATAVLP